MIQLRWARFENYRLLRDVTVEFSCDPAQPMTVVRAENDTGKTTMLTALAWGLFGDVALPGGRASYRLHPIDWSADDLGRSVTTTVALEFAAIDDVSGEQVVYEVNRQGIDELIGPNSFRGQAATVTLFQHTRAGMRPIDNPTAVIESLLPESLRDIFFLDGDRALAFIEATDEERIKRDRVEKAIRSLLGLNLLERAEAHVDAARRDAVRAIARLGAGTDIERLASAEEALDSEEEALQARIVGIEESHDATEIRHRRADKQLKDALAAGAGDLRQLGSDLEDAERDLKTERRQYDEMLKAHRSMLNAPSLIPALAPSILDKVTGILGDLEARRVIPSTLPNVIENRLDLGTCICGADLSDGTTAHCQLMQLLEESRSIDESKERLQVLNDGVKRTARDLASGESSSDRLQRSQGQLHACLERQRRLERAIQELRTRIGNLDDADLTVLEATVAREFKELKRLHSELARAQETMRLLRGRRSDLDKERRSAERTNQRVLTGVRKEEAAKDVLSVLRETVRVLQHETLDEVSERMNEIFLAMIVADEEAGSIVRGAQLTRSHDIIVFGPDERTIDPDIDLNGASRRALTLAFILALVDISGVRAPNIIDTPLGMMGIEVRQAVLRYAAQHSSQLIMFLTGSEIVGVEDLLDDVAGKSYTFTNSAHYPTKLLNDPGTGRMETILCGCGHRHECDICRRKVGLPLSSVVGG